MELIRWKKRGKPWSKWHILQEETETQCLCGIDASDETAGTEFTSQHTSEGAMGKEICQSCFHSYYGLGPQFKRIRMGTQRQILALGERFVRP